MSRQYEYNKRMKARNRCMRCGQPSQPKTTGGFYVYCLCHVVMVREAQRKLLDIKKRNLNTESYKHEIIHTIVNRNDVMYLTHEGGDLLGFE